MSFLKKRGFTLIELLIVIAIIAILALIAVPNFLEAQVRAKVSRAKADMRSIATALESYYVDFNAYPRPIVQQNGAYEWDHRAYAFWMWFELPDPSVPWQLSLLNSRMTALTTPIAYMTNHAPPDPFAAFNENGTFYDLSFHYYNFQLAVRKILDDPDRFESGIGPDPDIQMVVAPTPVRLNGPEGRVYRANWALMSPGPSRDSQYPSLLNPATDVYTRYFLYRTTHWNNMLNGAAASYDPTNGTVSYGNIWRFSGGQSPE